MAYNGKRVFQKTMSFAIFVFTAQILITFQSFFQNKLFSNAFELTEFGIISTILITMATIKNMFTLGIGNSIIRFARKQESPKYLIMTSIIIFSALSLGLLTIFLFSYYFGIRLFQIENYFLILIIILIVSYLRLVIYVYYALFIGIQSSTGLLFSNVFPYYLNLFLVTLISLLHGWTIINVLIGIIVGETISCSFLFFYSSHKFGIGSFSQKYFRRILKYSGPSIITIFSWRLFEFTIILILINFLGPESVGIYTIAFSIKNILNLVINVINISITPMLYDFFDNKQYIIIKKFVPIWIKIYITFFFVISFALFAFSPFLVVLISNSSFMQAVSILPFLFLITIFQIFESYVIIPYQFKEKMASSEIRKGLAIAITFPLPFFLIPMMGLIGAPISLCIHYFLKTIFLLPHSQRLFHFDLKFTKLFFIASFSIVAFLIGSVLRETYHLNFEISFLLPIPLFILAVFISKSIKTSEIKLFLRLILKNYGNLLRKSD